MGLANIEVFLPGREELGQNLKRLRLEREMSQQQVGEGLGVQRSTYTYMENGKTVPDALQVIRLAEIFGVTADEILGRK